MLCGAQILAKCVGMWQSSWRVRAAAYNNIDRAAFYTRTHFLYGHFIYSKVKIVCQRSMWPLSAWHRAAASALVHLSGLACVLAGERAGGRACACVEWSQLKNNIREKYVPHRAAADDVRATTMLTPPSTRDIRTQRRRRRVIQRWESSTIYHTESTTTTTAMSSHYTSRLLVATRRHTFSIPCVWAGAVLCRLNSYLSSGPAVPCDAAPPYLLL